MAQMENVVKEIFKITTYVELAEVKDAVKKREEELLEEENKENIEKYKNKLRIGDTVKFRSGNKKQEGEVVAIYQQRITVDTKGKRKRSVKWNQITEIVE
jgi:putative ribosome biogenesis GTPase RsgA